MKIDHITYKGRTWHFKEPQEVKINYHATFEIEVSLFGRSESAAFWNDALDKLYSGFATDWDHIAMKPDEELTGDAIELKRRILDVIEKVEEKAK